MAALLPFLHLSHPFVTDCICTHESGLLLFFLTAHPGVRDPEGFWYCGEFSGAPSRWSHTSLSAVPTTFTPCSSALLLFATGLAHGSHEGISCLLPGSELLRKMAMSIPRMLSPVFAELLTGGARGAGLPLEMPLILCIILPPR